MFRIAGMAVGAVMAASMAVSAQAEAIKIAFIDPLSGPFASSGTSGLAEWEFAVEELVNKPGVMGDQTFEIVPFDNKLSAKESLIQLQVAIDQGIRIIAQGLSSGVANALTEAVAKHNRRNPGDQVIFINYAAIDPALTGEKCSFWHFAFDANADIKMDALTDVIAQDEGTKKIYLIGQDYSFGKAVAAAAVSELGEKRPDIQIVGNELHPIGKVKDFTPYARKIVASGADAIITGNWGSDMVGLGKAVIQAGFTGPIYTYYASGNGITKTFGEAGKGVIHLIADSTLNPPASDRMSAYVDAFKAKHPGKDITLARITNAAEMLAKAIDAAGSTEAEAVAGALAGMRHPSLWGSEVYVRPEDHQIIQDVHVLEHTNEGVIYDLDASGFGLVKSSTVSMAAMDSPTACTMTRP
ncbi:MAG: branched-chain amino acid ABC transporter substrate-binding protein [Pseudomonadota bacterium]